MKYVRVFYKEYEGRQIGDVESVHTSPPAPLLSHCLKVVEVEDSVDLSIKKAVVDENDEITFVDDAEKIELKELKQKEAQVAALYKTMDDAVFNKVEEVFKTKRPDSATATALTYVLMYLVPEKFADKGLKNGNIALDTDVKIKVFAEQMVDQIVDHAVFRIKEIEKFKAAKDAVIGG